MRPTARLATALPVRLRACANDLLFFVSEKNRQKKQKPAAELSWNLRWLTQPTARVPSAMDAAAVFGQLLQCPEPQLGALGPRHSDVTFETNESEPDPINSIADKKLRRRLQNRRAAKVSRARKKAYISKLESQTEELQRQVAELRQRNRDLESRLVTLESTGRGPPECGLQARRKSRRISPYARTGRHTKSTSASSDTGSATTASEDISNDLKVTFPINQDATESGTFPDSVLQSVPKTVPSPAERSETTPQQMGSVRAPFSKAPQETAARFWSGMAAVLWLCAADLQFSLSGCSWTSGQSPWERCVPTKTSNATTLGSLATRFSGQSRSLLLSCADARESRDAATRVCSSRGSADEWSDPGSVRVNMKMACV